MQRPTAMEAESSRSRCWWGRFLLGLSPGHLLPMSSPGCSAACVRLYPDLFLERHHSDWIRPTLITLFYLNHLFNGPISKYSHILRGWGLGLQQMNRGLGRVGAAIQPITEESGSWSVHVNMAEFP